MRGFLSAFSVKSFRFQWPADLLSSFALEMEVLILNWFVLVETKSVTALALFAGLQYLGSLIAPAMGALADRIGRRRTLSTLRALYTALAVIIMMLDLCGFMEPIYIFVIAAIAGLIRPSDLVMRNALIGDTMPSDKLANAMGLSRTTMDTARMTGALVGAGLLTMLGLGIAYAFVAALYFLSFVLTLRVAHIDTDDAPSTPVNPFRQVLDGLAYVRRTPAVLALMWLAFLVNLTGFPLVSNSGLLSYVAREVYGLDATGLSHLAASFGVGSLVASIVMAATGGARRPIYLVFGGTAIWHILLLVFAFSSEKTEGMALLFLVGVAQGVAMISMAVALLRLAEARFRGRVMGVRMLAVYGLPMGLALVGPATDALGFQGAALAAASFGLGIIALIAVIWRRALFFDH
ncbi:MAG: MFS transporter [Rhodospirillales bacterium]